MKYIFDVFEHNFLVTMFWVFEVFIKNLKSPVGPVERVWNRFAAPQTLVSSLDLLRDEWMDGGILISEATGWKVFKLIFPI